MPAKEEEEETSFEKENEKGEDRPSGERGEKKSLRNEEKKKADNKRL